MRLFVCYYIGATDCRSPPQTGSQDLLESLREGFAVVEVLANGRSRYSVSGLEFAISRLGHLNWT